MESSKRFFCHSCKEEFTKPVPEEEEVQCPKCQDYFVEMLEDQAMDDPKVFHTVDKQIGSNDKIVKDCNNHQLPEFSDSHFNEEEKKEQTSSNFNYQHPTSIRNSFSTHSGHFSPPSATQNGHLQNQPDWLGNFQEQINHLMRNHGQTRSVNSNGRNINVTTTQGYHGNTGIMVANIESQMGLPEEEINQQNNDQHIEHQQREVNTNHSQSLQSNYDQLNEDQRLSDGGQEHQQHYQQQQQNPQQQQQQPFQNLLGYFSQGQRPSGPLHMQVHNLTNGGFGLNGLLGNIINQNQFTMNGFYGGASQESQEQSIINQVIQASLETAQNGQGTPTSKDFIEKLCVIKGTDVDQREECQVCFDAFQDPDQILKLPCKHMFHQDCLLPWLVKHNTCPTCRHQLPADDPSQNNRSDTTILNSFFL